MLEVFLGCGGLWEVNRVFDDVAEKGSSSSNSVRDDADWVAASKVMWFLCSGLVRFDDMAMDAPGVFLVINGLGDMLMMVGDCCRVSGIVRDCVFQARKIVWSGVNGVWWLKFCEMVWVGW